MSQSHSHGQPRLNRRNLLKGLGLTAAAATLPAGPALAQPGETLLRGLRSAQERRVRAVTAPTLPGLGVVALNRMAFGPRPGDIAAFNALGSTAEARLQAYVEQQLAPQSIDDSAFQTRVDADNFTTINKSLAQLWLDHRVNYNTPPPEFTHSTYTYRLLPAYDIERLAFNRALHSKRQLLEVLADFWHNHFNVYGWEGDIAPVLVHYDRDVIRAYALGNFREMVEAVATSTAMLYYLDNRTNTGGTPNENFARELFELHTMGAENYLGVTPQDQVPDENGEPIAYVDDDVYGATTCFTGWTVDESTGEFFYDSNKHFPNQKVVFGHIIPANQAPLKDGRDVLDMLINHPGTGRFIARKLCRRFISDNPPESIVNQAAAVFTANKDHPDQLKMVVQTILLSDEFKTTWGQKIKRPFEFITSALRGIGTNFWLPAKPYDAAAQDYVNSFLSYYNRIGQPLFSWRAPTGYSDIKEDWSGTVPLVQRWRMSNWMLDWRDNNIDYINVLGATPADRRTPNELADFWINRLLGRPMDNPEDRQEIVDFMAQGKNPDFDLPLDTDQDTQHRLRMMVSLIINSPDFQWR